MLNFAVRSLINSAAGDKKTLESCNTVPPSPVLHSGVLADGIAYEIYSAGDVSELALWVGNSAPNRAGYCTSNRVL